MAAVSVIGYSHRMPASFLGPGRFDHLYDPSQCQRIEFGLLQHGRIRWKVIQLVGEGGPYKYLGGGTKP